MHWSTHVPSLNRKTILACALPILAALTLNPAAALAYIGPGAGFALGGSFLFILIGVFLGLTAMLLWPIRWLLRRIRSRDRLMRARWWTLKPHKHIWHFALKGLMRLLSEHGLDPVRIVRNPMRRANLARPDSLAVLARRS